MSGCQDPAFLNTVIVSNRGGMTFHNILIIICAACCGVTTLFSVIGVGLHLSRYTVPSEQRMISRILLLPAICSIVSLLGAIFYDAAPYVRNVIKLYEAIGICAIFELFVASIVPGSAPQRDAFFEGLRVRSPFAEHVKSGGGSLDWFRTRSLHVYQILPTTVILVTASWVTLGVYCGTSTKAATAQAIIRVFTMLVVVVAVIAILRFHRRMKAELEPHHAVKKLVAFKLLVILEVLQSFIFAILTKSSQSHPPQNLSPNDYTVGLQSLLLSCEAVLFSLWYLSVFRASSYRQHSAPEIGFVAALGDVLNISDLFYGCSLAFSSFDRASEN
ncbi:MAG: hypothetical protein M1838_005064 [Thelocarpon superellum]|nr:MAG: hypothetical protein M1838_005064 [Thelocarpon superellum]